MAIHNYPTEITEVDCRLRPVCFDCPHLDVCTEKNSAYGQDAVLHNTEIFCKHEETCLYIYQNSTQPTVSKLVREYLEKKEEEGYDGHGG